MPRLLLKYFPGLTGQQQQRFARLGGLYAEWNDRVNLVSRQDLAHLYERHVLHSLGIAKVAAFAPGTRVIDVGTGGGFPLVPLAILLPHCSFHGIDGTGKKIAAVQGVIEALGLENCTAEHVRSEDHAGRYDMIVSRAVTAMPAFVRMVRHLVPRGKGYIYYLKGGELADELLPLPYPYRVHELGTCFDEGFFATKKVVEVRL
jgi:16S rRNA (guanine527-N7)-methyltransferase